MNKSAIRILGERLRSLGDRLCVLEYDRERKNPDVLALEEKLAALPTPHSVTVWGDVMALVEAYFIVEEKKYQETLVGEPFLCERRHSMSGPLPGPDRWQFVGRDRTCTYCGSLHPEDLEKICVEAAKADSQAEVSRTDKNYKLYARWAETSNAMDGGIKFYVWHLPKDAVANESLQKKIDAAVRASDVRFEARLASARPRTS